MFYRYRFFILIALFVALSLPVYRVRAQVPQEASPQSIQDLQTQIIELQKLAQELNIRVQNQASVVALPPVPIITTPASSVGSQFNHTLRRGSTDKTTGGEVSRLQSFLLRDATIFPGGSVTGYFGPLTEKSVQRLQAKYGIVLSGTPATTGYGLVGSKTRALLNRLAGGPLAPTLASLSASTANITQSITITGSGFSTSTDDIVYFGEAVVTPDFVSNDGKTLRFSVPAADAGEYLVRVAYKNSISNGFLVTVKEPGRKFIVLAPTNLTIARTIAGSASASNTIAVGYISGTNVTNAATISLKDLPYKATAAPMTPCVPACSRINIISITPDTPEGTTPITVVVKTNDYISTATFNLTVLPYIPFQFSLGNLGDIAIAKSSVLNVTTTITITAVPTQGIAKPIAFSAANLPAGITMRPFPFCTPPCAATSTLTVAPTATQGDSTITVNGVSGSASAATTFNLHVNPPSASDFSMALSPDSLTVVTPASGSKSVTSTISIGLLSGDPLTLTFAQDGLPTGVTAAVISCTAPCTKTGALVNVSSATAPGIYQIILSAAGGGVAHSLTYSLVVDSPPPFSFALSNSGDISVSQPYSGAATSSNIVSVDLLSGGGQSIAISQSGFPGGASAQTLGSCSPPCNKTNTISVGSGTPAGSFSITVMGSAGGLVSTTAYTLTVYPFVPQDFYFTNSGDIFITRSFSGTVTASNIISAQYLSGTPSPVTFTQSGLPSGAGATFISSCTPDCSTTNTITIGPNTTPGDYTIIFKGVGGGSTNTMSYMLHVQ